MRNIPKWIKNKYLIIGVVFLVWLIFFDRNNLINQTGYVFHLNELRHQKTYLENELDSTEGQLKQLLSGQEELERFAREQYFMQRDNEDVFIIKE